MSWTYSGDPSASPLDEVRFLTGDTQPDDPFLSNEEILYNIKVVSGGSPPSSGNFLAAAYCADLLVARYSRSADESVGDVSISYSQRFKNFTDLASQLRRRATFAGVPMYVGGISLADKQANEGNPDLPSLAFKIDGMSRITDDTNESLLTGSVASAGPSADDGGVSGILRPNETIDGQRKTFSFLQLPSQFLLIWNGIVQDPSSFSVTGNSLTVTSAPQIGDAFYVYV